MHDTVVPRPLIFQATVPVGEVVVPALVSVTVTVAVILVPGETVRLLGVMAVPVFRLFIVTDPEPELWE